ncbi:uncharacterized protein [Lepidochelys kempii]|uniref:uncharacterized protein n=1 Tax=Lepidochelys kempii TaxID=8472 RepID=UPI003C6F4808
MGSLRLCSTPRPPSARDAPLTEKGLQRWRVLAPGSPSPGRRGRGGQESPLPLPAPRTFCFSSQGQRTMRRRDGTTHQQCGARRRPGASGAVSPPHPACGGVGLAARPPSSRRRQRFAARRHRPPPARSPVRSARLAALRLPGTPECRARSGPRGRCPGASPTPATRAAAEPPGSLVAAASPAILCGVCERESVSPVFSQLLPPLPPHNMAARVRTHCGGEGAGPALLPPAYRSFPPLPAFCACANHCSPPAPMLPPLRARRAPLPLAALLPPSSSHPGPARNSAAACLLAAASHWSFHPTRPTATSTVAAQCGEREPRLPLPIGSAPSLAPPPVTHGLARVLCPSPKPDPGSAWGKGGTHVSNCGAATSWEISQNLGNFGVKWVSLGNGEFSFTT